MDKKRVGMFIVLFLLLTSLLTVAQTEEKSACSGFWCKVEKFFSGPVVGKAAGEGQ